MNQKVVRLDDIFYLFNNVAGGADIDNVYEAYGHLDLNKDKDRTYLIKSSVIPTFNTAEPQQKDWIKYSLSYFITHDSDAVKQKSSDYLFPFDFPGDTKNFLIEIYKSLFVNENLVSTDQVETVIT